MQRRANRSHSALSARLHTHTNTQWQHTHTHTQTGKLCSTLVCSALLVSAALCWNPCLHAASAYLPTHTLVQQQQGWLHQDNKLHKESEKDRSSMNVLSTALASDPGCSVSTVRPALTCCVLLLLLCAASSLCVCCVCWHAGECVCWHAGVSPAHLQSGSTQLSTAVWKAL